LLEKIDQMDNGDTPGELYAVSRECHRGLRHRLRTIAVPFSAVHGYDLHSRAGIQHLTDVPSVQELLSADGLTLDQISHVEFEEDCTWGDDDSLATLSQLRVLSAPGASLSLIAANRCLQVLDLGRCSLVDLEGLTPIRHTLNTLRLKSEHLRDFSALRGCTELTILSLRWCKSLTNLSVLAECTQLTTLDLPSCRIVDISALAACPQLTTLDLRFNPITDISALAACTQLTTLSLPWTDIRTASSLDHCPKLTTLDMTGCHELIDISALADCPLLTSLDMVECYHLGRIAPLVGCKRLQHLDITGCSGINDVHTIGSMESLTSLYMGTLDVTLDVPRHRGLTTLHVFSGTGVDFRRFPGVTTLHIDSTDQTNLAGIGDCTLLRELILLDCAQLTDLSALVDCPELRVLQITSCQSLTHVHTYRSLTHLRIDRCPNLTHVHVSGNRSLTHLRIDRCPNLTHVDVSGHRSLQHLRVNKCSNLSVVEAADCQRLQSIELRKCASMDALNIPRNPALVTLKVSQMTVKV
jgi:Leucine-rich repeat (LRR) protein